MGEPNLFVSADGLVASLEMLAGDRLEAEAFQALLAKAGIVHGLEEPAQAAAAREVLGDRTLVVARGDPAQPGADGWIEPLVREPSAVYGSGTVDLRDLHHFREVAAGTPLLRLHPPTEGVPGTTVRGAPIRTRPGRPANLGPCVGPGCAPAPDDDTLIVAAVDGLYQRFTRGKLPYVQVTTRVEVPADVDMTIGHIDTRFPILIQGDIRGGFLVKTVADLEVMGSVEDARCSVRGDIVIHGGLLPGRQRLKAHGDVKVRHVQGREIKARHVTVEHGCLGATIRATGTVTAREIIGGEIHAAAGVFCDLLGDQAGVPTLVQTGIDPYEDSLFAWATGRLPELEHERQALRERGHLLAHRVHTLLSAGECHASEDLALRQVVTEAHRLHQEEERCRAILTNHPLILERFRALEQQAAVVVRRAVLPGVTIAIGGASLKIHQRLPPTTFRNRNGLIVGT